MHLIYFDESGNTGNNLNDHQQPIFVLCALAVPEDRWLQVEQGLQVETEKFFPSPRPDDFEIHATDLTSSRRWFKSISLADRLAFRDAWFSVAVKHELTIVLGHAVVDFGRTKKEAARDNVLSRSKPARLVATKSIG
jgi:hypothetical protein